jgi:hypothetical protein
MPERAVSPYFGIGMDKDISEVIDSKSGAYIRSLGETDASESLHNPKQQPINAIEKISRESRDTLVVPSPKPINSDRPERLLAQERGLRTARHIRIKARNFHDLYSMICGCLLSLKSL